MVSYFGTDNNARTMVGTVTVAGVNFGNRDFTPSGRVDTNECVTSTWTSFTSVSCELTHNPTIHSVEVTVSGFVSTRYPQFTFDGVLAAMQCAQSVCFFKNTIPPRQLLLSATCSARTGRSPRH